MTRNSLSSIFKHSNKKEILIKKNKTNKKPHQTKTTTPNNQLDKKNAINIMIYKNHYLDSALPVVTAMIIEKSINAFDALPYSDFLLTN